MKILPEKLNEEIILSAKNGQIDAFEEIVFFYEKRIFFFLYRTLKNQEEAADVTQETFLKLYQNLYRYDPEKNFNSWIFTIAKHLAYDFLRKQKTRKEDFILDNDDRKIFFSEKAPVTPRERDDILSIKINMEKALGKIQKKHMRVLRLYYYEGYNYQQIAILLEKPMNTIKTLLRRAKQELYKQYIEH